MNDSETHPIGTGAALERRIAECEELRQRWGQAATMCGEAAVALLAERARAEKAESKLATLKEERRVGTANALEVVDSLQAQLDQAIKHHEEHHAKELVWMRRHADVFRALRRHCPHPSWKSIPYVGHEACVDCGAVRELPCPHSRPVWRLCPHCNGSNAQPEGGA